MTIGKVSFSKLMFCLKYFSAASFWLLFTIKK